MQQINTKYKKYAIIAGAAILLYAILRGGKTELTEQYWKNNKDKILSPLKGLLILTSSFGYRNNPLTGQPGQFHNGADLVMRNMASAGQPVYAPYSGKILKKWYNAFGGHQLIIDSGYAKFGFAHLMEESPFSVGDIVKIGQVIGKLGNTGTSTGPHLHFTLRLNDALVDPVSNIPALKKAIL
jgi:murein DD-endopeptidase MepM/ murein hydrolase activator NlpD